ncbi:hypothetical protein HQ308_16860 [Rhodococcus sp. BP-241]|uniref:hypothetical protein n=1 Tax=Rhodococcus sp. BP-241 TaxID=2739441 RepID=UPI001C9B97D3|nr:hypothetical protein [Rhodococcus sp. BP-241]MBY6708473.1 hypothetical protein [Rhodococcus sp. BP-241]
MATSNNASSTLAAAIDAGRELAERRDTPDRDRVPTINVNGRSIAVDTKFQPLHDRDRAWLEALASSTAQRELDTTIRVANRDRDFGDKLEHRTITDKEAERAYRQIVKDGAHRAETGQSATSVLDDAINGVLGSDDDATPERKALDEQRATREQYATIAAQAAAAAKPWNHGRPDADTALVYDPRARAFRRPEHVTAARGADRGLH